MAIKRQHSQFRTPKITYVDYTQIEMDRVLTLLFPRLKFDGYSSIRVPRHKDLEINDFLDEFLKLSTERKFIGFEQEPEIIKKWIETDLLDLVNRGKDNQAVASPRPLHGHTYKFRNTNHTRDYGAAEHLYWMLHHSTKGQGARDYLKQFFFKGVDLNTDKYDHQVMVDVETQALLRLDEQVEQDRKDTKKLDVYSPLFKGNADILADDIIRLLYYQNHIPRSVLVDYIKNIFSFHLALYHLRLLKVLPQAVNQKGQNLREIAKERPLDSPPRLSLLSNQIGILVDMGGIGNEHMTELAMQSTDLYYRRIPEYIRAHLVVKKLDEWAEYQASKLGKMALPPSGYFEVQDLLDMLDEDHDDQREPFFASRLADLIEGKEELGELDPEIKQIISLQLSNFETYIEILFWLRGRQRQRIIECLDSFLQKHSDNGLLRQSSVKGSPRWFYMGSRLLETLLQIAVLTQNGTSYLTKELKVSELLDFLRLRYGLHIDRLPEHDGFGSPSILDRQALRNNVAEFKNRLREIGFFVDLSDAYITQTVTPRYTIVD